MAVVTRTDVDRRLLDGTAGHGTGNGNGNGQGGARRGGPFGRALVGGRRRWWWTAVAAVAVAATLVGVQVATGTTTYPVRAEFARAPGLFPGAAVEVLGVPVGTVTSVRTVGDHVDVGLAIDHGRPLPARATASLVSPALLGEPSIELSPGYTGGPALRPGTVIPLARTAVPVSTEQLLRSLERTLSKVDPHAVGSLVANLAQDLQGQGAALNTLIHGAAGTLRLLATKADNLGQLSGALAQLTGTLDSRSATITELITDYDTVSAVIAQHGAQLGGAITALSQASTELVQLLVPNLGPLESDVGTVTTVGRTLGRNLTSVDQILSSATSLFAGAERAYTPAHNWLTLNLQTPPGVTGALLAGLVRDRLAGICRRIAAHHAAGLTAAQRSTLTTCGNPASSYFSPIIDQIPAILSAVAAGQAPPAGASPLSMLQQGLATIPGAPGAAPGAASGSSPGQGPSAGAPSGPTTTTAPPPGGSPQTTCLGGLLGGTVTCTTGSGGNGGSATGGSGSGGSATGGSAGSTGGLGGLLSYDVPVGHPGDQPVSQPGDQPGSRRPAAAAPSLVAAAARALGPLPQGAPGATAGGSHGRAARRGHRAGAVRGRRPAAAGGHAGAPR